METRLGVKYRREADGPEAHADVIEDAVLNCAEMPRRVPTPLKLSHCRSLSYCAVAPPSTRRLVPVIMRAASEARNSAAVATSSGVATCLSGIIAMTAAL